MAPNTWEKMQANYSRKVVHTVQTVGPYTFGVGQVVLNLAKEQNNAGIESVIWCLNSDHHIQWASASSGLLASQIRAFGPIGPTKFGVSFEMERAAASESHGISIIHQHGLWSGLSRVTNVLRNLNTIPSVVTPHGALEKWALKKSWWKKKLVLTLYEWDNLYNASCLHAVGENEIQHFRDFGLSNPIAVIPNGISSDWLTSCGDPEAFRCRFGIPSDRRILLFLSRITPKKGLPMLLEALRDLQDVLADWLLVIAGEDEFGHRREVERLVEFFGLKRAVIIVGPLFDQSKRDAFAAADLFVLPSHSEGAPLVILEALSSGVPVLATKASPWEDLQVHSCGWWTNISKEAIAEALRDAFSRSPGDLENMGFRGRNLIATRFTWSKSAGMTIQLYEWLLGQRDIPEFVVLG